MSRPSGDQGYVGVEGISVVPNKRSAECDLRPCEKEFNLAYNGIRAAIERAVATVKTWRMLSPDAAEHPSTS
jgi:hypothetical protein